MEAVLKVRVPGISMPWREMVRGCLVILWFSILCFCVQNYAQRNEAVKSVPAGGAVKHRAAAVAREADLTGIRENMKSAAVDMRKGQAGSGLELSLAVRAVPIRNMPGGESVLSWATAEAPYELPVIDLGLTDGREPSGFKDLAGTSDVPSVIPEDETVDMKWVESEVAEDTPIADPEEIPGEVVVPEEPVASEEPVIPEEIAGFLLDGEGYITGCTERVIVRDDLLLIPESESCVGIRSGALDVLGESVMEVYIPANICDIEPGVFSAFPYLMFVEVSGDNPYYYSLDGIVYSVSGEEVFCPAGRTTE